MNTLGQTIVPGTIVRVAPSQVKPEYAADTTFVCRGGGGLNHDDRPDPLEPEGDWLIYGIWQLDGKHGIISSDLIVEIVSEPQMPLPVLTFNQIIDWIPEKEEKE